MSLAGPFTLRLAFHVFVVAVGTLILAGAVNTAIVGSNGVLNRVSEDGVLADWFRQPHRKYRNFQSHHQHRGRLPDHDHHCQPRRRDVSRQPVRVRRDLELHDAGHRGAGDPVHASRRSRISRAVEFSFVRQGNSAGPGADHGDLISDRHREPVYETKRHGRRTDFLVHHVRSVYGFRTITQKNRGAAHVEMDQFNVAAQEELSPQSVGVRPGKHSGPDQQLSRAIPPAGSAGPRTDRSAATSSCCMFACSAGLLPDRANSKPSSFLAASSSSCLPRPCPWRKNAERPIHLAVVSANDLWGGILNAAVKLEASTDCVGAIGEGYARRKQAREIGLAWEQLPDPRPQFNLEIFTPGGQREFFLLGPHAPNLTSNEVRLVHRLWLRFSDLVAPDELHHHDVVHFALDEVIKELEEGKEADVVARLKEHISRNKSVPTKQ